MKLLITGANGLFAQSYIDNISHQYLNDYEIILTSNSEQIKRTQFNFVKVNLLENSQVKDLMKSIQPDMLIHFAWEVRKTNYLNDISNKEWYLKSKLLIDEFYKLGGTKFVGIGTLAEYSPIVEEIYLKSPRSPATLYGEYKNKLYEYLDSSYPGRYMWIRLGSVFSLKSQRINLFQKIFKSIKDKVEINLPLIQHPYLNISTYGCLMSKLIEETLDLRQVNLAAHIPISTSEIITILRNKLNIDIKYKLNRIDENNGIGNNYYLSQYDKDNYEYGIIDSRKEFENFIHDNINLI